MPNVNAAAQPKLIMPSLAQKPTVDTTQTYLEKGLPNCARLSEAPGGDYANLKSTEPSEVKAALHSVETSQDLVSTLNDKKYSKHFVGKHGVRLEYKFGPWKHPDSQTRKKIGDYTLYTMPAEQAVMVLAGSHDEPDLFASAVFQADDQAVREALEELHGHLSSLPTA